MHTSTYVSTQLQACTHTHVHVHLLPRVNAHIHIRVHTATGIHTHSRPRPPAPACQCTHPHTCPHSYRHAHTPTSTPTCCRVCTRVLSVSSGYRNPSSAVLAITPAHALRIRNPRLMLPAAPAPAALALASPPRRRSAGRVRAPSASRQRPGGSRRAPAHARSAAVARMPAASDARSAQPSATRLGLPGPTLRPAHEAARLADSHGNIHAAKGARLRAGVRVRSARASCETALAPPSLRNRQS